MNGQYNLEVYIVTISVVYLDGHVVYTNKYGLKLSEEELAEKLDSSKEI